MLLKSGAEVEANFGCRSLYEGGLILRVRSAEINKGDLLSLGSITKLTPTAPDTSIRARYVDLDSKGPVEISVKFK